MATIVSASLAVACGPSETARLAPEYDARTGQLERLSYDADRNGVAETIGHLERSRIVRVDVDVDGDGRMDRWEYYGSDQRLEKVGFSARGDGRENAWSYADASGAITRIEIAAGTDPSRVSRTEHFQDGVLIRAEEDTNADGQVDKWETYREGRLTRLAFREGGTAPVTRALSYGADGSVRIEEATDVPSTASSSAR